MKFFQKRGVAIVVLILAIVASSAWGLHKAPAVSTPEGGGKARSLAFHGSLYAVCAR